MKRTINFELFSNLLNNLRCTYNDSTPDPMSRTELKARILEAALRVAVVRAYKKYRWPDNFECFVEIDAFGGVSNCKGKKNGVDSEQAAYLETEVSKIAAAPLRALGK